MLFDRMAELIRPNGWLYIGHSVKVLPGEHYVSPAADEMIVTVLGSCVVACIRDPLIEFCGMNHFMLPDSAGGA